MRTNWLLTAGAVALALTLSALPAAANCGSCAAGEQVAAKTCGGAASCADKTACDKTACDKTACDKTACDCAGECAGECAGKCDKAAAAETTASAASDCRTCAPIASVLGSDEGARLDIVNLQHGAVMVVVASRPDLIRAIQTAADSVDNRMSKADGDGLCGSCTKLSDLREAGITTRTQKISSGTLLVFTGKNPDQVAGIRSWADGLRQALAQSPPADGASAKTLASNAL